MNIFIVGILKETGVITGEHFQSLEYLVQKCDTFFNLVAQLSVLNS